MHDLTIPIKTGRGLNDRELWPVRAKRVKREREAVSWVLVQLERPKLPCSVTLTRVAPSSGLDDDGLVGSLKAVRDEVAAWLGVNDRDRMRVRYRYAQERGPWGVRIEFGPPVSGAQLEFGDGGSPWSGHAQRERDAFGPVPPRVAA